MLLKVTFLVGVEVSPKSAAGVMLRVVRRGEVRCSYKALFVREPASECTALFKRSSVNRLASPARLIRSKSYRKHRDELVLSIIDSDWIKQALH